jgi:hypothetical protein
MRTGRRSGTDGGGECIGVGKVGGGKGTDAFEGRWSASRKKVGWPKSTLMSAEAPKRASSATTKPRSSDGSMAGDG